MSSISDFMQYVIWKKEKRMIDVEIRKLELEGHVAGHLHSDPLKDEAMRLFAISNNIVEDEESYENDLG